MKAVFVAAVMLLALHCGQAALRREVVHKVTRGVNAVFGTNSLAQQLGLSDRYGFLAGESVGTSKGHNRQRISQTLDGLAVVGATGDVEVTRNGVVTGTLSGHLAFHLENDIPNSAECDRDESVLLQRAGAYMVENHMISASLLAATPMLRQKLQKKVYFEGEEGQAKLVWEVQFLLELAPTPCRPYFLFDACDDSLPVLVNFDKIHNATLALRERRQAVTDQCDTPATTPSTAAPTTASPSTAAPTTAAPTTAGPTTQPPTGACPSSAPGQGVGGNTKTGQTDYGIDRPFCLYTQVAGNTCTFTSKFAQVIDLEFGTSANGKSPLTFTCSEGHSDAINGAFGVANDAFYFGDSTGQMYEQWYGFYALGYSPQLRVHYSNCYQNAFWDGTHMTFGDGCSSLYPLVSQDVVAHELGHGITDRYSDLFYSGQSGGINEAFSDMSGEVAELFSRNTNDWEVGRELFKGNQALRYFETPSRDGRSIDNAADYTSGMDVHYSSGVFNRAYWQLVNVQNVPLRQAYEIFLQANKVIWGQTTNYQQGACGAMQAAYDLGYSVDKVKAAFSVVGIDLSSCNFQAFTQSMASGDTRDGVIISDLRNPVFHLDVPNDVTVTITANSKDDANVRVLVTSDAAGNNVVAIGRTNMAFDVTGETYFKLSSSSKFDISSDITVEVVS